MFQARALKLTPRAIRSGLLPAILRRVVNPIEPFGFLLHQDCLPLPRLQGLRKSLRQTAEVFEQPDEIQINGFEHTQRDFTALANRGLNRR